MGKGIFKGALKHGKIITHPVIKSLNQAPLRELRCGRPTGPTPQGPDSFSGFGFKGSFREDSLI